MDDEKSEKDREAFIRCKKCISIPLIDLNLSEENPKVIPYCRCKEKNGKSQELKDFLEKNTMQVKLTAFFCKECDIKS